MSISRTPLYRTHRGLGAKMAPFHGWEMPIQYSSIIEESRTVRENAGLFDVSHMGQIEVRGEHAMELIQRLTPTDLASLEEGRARYTVLLNENGGIIDDLLVYAVSERRFLLCVNAANTGKDLDWLADHALQYPDVEVTNLTRRYGMLALQGPAAEQIMRQVTDYPVFRLERFQFTVINIDETAVILARTGYTGEDGFEMLSDWRETPAVWERIMTRGKSYGIKPIGLGARDVLRLEAGYLLCGQDMDESTTPREAGLGWLVTPGKEGGFIGRDALMKQREEGPSRLLAGIEMVGRGVPRTGYELYHGDEKVGRVTSGTMSPALGAAIGLAYVRAGLAADGTRLEVDIRGKRVDAVVRKTPFVKPGAAAKKQAAEA